MKTFNIYVSRQGESEAVKQGWSWPAFFFGAIWALVKKLWLAGFGFLALFITLGIMEGYIGTTSGQDAADHFGMLTSLLSLGVSITFGLKGNAWRESNLTSRNFALKDTVEAVEEKLHIKPKEDLNEAEMKDLKAQLEQEEDVEENVKGILKDIQVEIDEAKEKKDTSKAEHIEDEIEEVEKEVKDMEKGVEEE